MAEQVRVGVVGTSAYVDMRHLPYLKSHAGAQVAAICGRHRDRAEALAGKYGIPQVFTDYRAMLTQGHLQALVVAVPDDLHYPITMDALDLGLHVLCEKPLALSAPQAKAMWEKAEAAGVIHMTFFTYRWLPLYRHLHALLDASYIGRCLHCQLHYLSSLGRAPRYAWRFDRQRSHGVVGDLGSHMLDLARWYVGEVAGVHAHLTTCVERPGLDDHPLDAACDVAALTLDFANGAQGVMQLSAVAHVGDAVQEQHLALYGTAGSLLADRPLLGPGAARGARGDESQLQALPVPDAIWGDVDRARDREAFVKQPVGDRLFIDAILAQRPVTPSFYDGWKVQQVIDAAIESGRTGCRVAVP